MWLKELTCIFNDNSNEHYIADWVFKFTHSCYKCGYEETKISIIGVDYETVDDYKCPLCGKNWFRVVTERK